MWPDPFLSHVLVSKAKGLASMLRMLGFNVLYDEVRGQPAWGWNCTTQTRLFFGVDPKEPYPKAGTIGKRYRRMDEAKTRREGMTIHHWHR